MDEFDNAEIKIETQNMHNHGGTPNVLSAVIVMMEYALQILKKLKEIEENQK